VVKNILAKLVFAGLLPKKNRKLHNCSKLIWLSGVLNGFYFWLML